MIGCNFKAGDGDKKKYISIFALNLDVAFIACLSVVYFAFKLKRMFTQFDRGVVSRNAVFMPFSCDFEVYIS